MHTQVNVDHLLYVEIGPRLGRVLTKMTKEIQRMADNFDRMTAAVDRVASEVDAVAAAIRNPATDNNNQATIDDLAGRLEAAADSLHSSVEAENVEDAGSAGIGLGGTSESATGMPTENPAPTETGGEAGTENPVEGQ